MPRHSETRILPYSVGQMYDLVADVEAYPEFLPWTAAARIKSRETVGEVDVMIADLVISFKVFRERFTSKVEMYEGEKRIETQYLDGPVKHLHSTWRFTDEEGSCKVSFDVDFEFKSRLLQGAAGLFFHEAMQRVVRAFEARAKELYG
ncbi:MAG: type II toxin-antitoxin system RatA family toxin [Pseudomonadota bacterium]